MSAASPPRPCISKTERPPLHPFPIVIALGGNLGPRREMLELACRHLERLGVRVARRSRLYWTRPMGGAAQPDYVNAAVAVRTGLDPDRLLDLCHEVESQLGRRRNGRHWASRPIDLDLILYDNVRRSGASLTLPHPGLARRDFVLAPLIDLEVPPLAAIAPHGWPVLLAALPPEERTIRYSAPWR